MHRLTPSMRYNLFYHALFRIQLFYMGLFRWLVSVARLFVRFHLLVGLIFLDGWARLILFKIHTTRASFCKFSCYFTPLYFLFVAFGWSYIGILRHLHLFWILFSFFVVVVPTSNVSLFIVVRSFQSYNFCIG